ncbi:hypothetical protein BSFA1_81930 (plasmid) [Burkholderia sp. SFA1]|nr:hypothetical protein BYI23_E003560 [Burkholderia sp. YI23]BBQ03065.1 hypothetical protein BSFA1_81930 [Burkholderia sp. SFA1]
MSQAANDAVAEMQVLNNVALFDFIIGGSTGEKTVEADDFIREVGKMLPRGTFSWVSKYRSEAKREILKVGVARRVNNRVRGYFVPLEQAGSLSTKLKKIKADFQAEKSKFLANLPIIIEDWANSPVNSGVTSSGQSRATLIRQHAPKREDLDRLLSFDTSAIRVGSTEFFGADDALQTEVKGLVGQAALEIADDVKKSWKGPNAGRTSSRVLGLIRRIRNKAVAMGVLSPKFSRLAEMCDKVLSAVPEGQNIEGIEFLMVSSLLSRCMKPEDILAEDSVKFDPLDVQLPDTGVETQQPATLAQPDTSDLFVVIGEATPNNEATQATDQGDSEQPAADPVTTEPVAETAVEPQTTLELVL